jgi:hypothetical protein
MLDDKVHDVLFSDTTKTWRNTLDPIEVFQCDGR